MLSLTSSLSTLIMILYCFSSYPSFGSSGLVYYYYNNNYYYYYYYYYHYYSVFISPITEHRSSRLDKDLPVLLVPLGELGMTNPCLKANFEQSSPVKVTTPLVRQIVAGSHQIPNDSFVKLLQQRVKSERAKALNSRQGSAYRRGSFTENLVST